MGLKLVKTYNAEGDIMPLYKKSLIFLLLIAVGVIGGTIFGISSSDNMTRIDKADKINQSKSISMKSDDAGNIIYVYVTGAVNKPGMVELESSNDNFRVSDAVNACGGLLPTADIDNLNMAEIINDGQHIRIPEKISERSSDNSTDDQSANPVNSNSDKSNKNIADNGSIVNINTAGPAELETLNGIGPKMAERIIEYRQVNGPFKTIDDIKNVKGIGSKKFDKIKDRLKVG